VRGPRGSILGFSDPDDPGTFNFEYPAAQFSDRSSLFLNAPAQTIIDN
jgi:hypothetical protein